MYSALMSVDWKQYTSERETAEYFDSIESFKVFCFSSFPQSDEVCTLRWAHLFNIEGGSYVAKYTVQSGFIEF